MRAEVDRFAGPRRIGIDEISRQRDHEYLTTAVDHDTGPRPSQDILVSAKHPDVILADVSLDRTPSFTLRQLSAFVAVAETGTLSAAAAQLMVSASAVSLAINDLEKAMHAQLCVRRRAPAVQLTPTGQAMLHRARVLLQHASEMEAESAGSGGELTGPLSIGCYPTVGPTVLPPLLAKFTERHPAVAIRFHEAMADELASKLHSGELDAVIVYDLDVPSTWQTATLLTRHPTLVVAHDHPLAGAGGPVPLAEVAGEPMVLLDTAPSAGHAMRVCAAAGFTPTIGYRTANYGPSARSSDGGWAGRSCCNSRS